MPVLLGVPPGEASEGGLISSAYAALASDKERVDFLVGVVKKLREAAGSASQRAVTASTDPGGQYAWAESQDPPINLDMVDNAQRSLPIWLAKVTGAAVPPPSLVSAVQSGQLDRIVAAVGLKPVDVLPGAAEPSSGGRRRRKTRKTRKTKRKTRRR